VEMADAVPPGFIVDPETITVFSGPPGGPFEPAGHTYTVVNTGAVPVEWEVAADVPWLRVSPAAGTVFPAESQAVTVAVDENAAFASPGVYFGRVRFTDLQTGAGLSRPVRLTVTSSGEYFTQQFTTSEPFNLANRSVTFVPEVGGQSYRATIRSVSAFPTDPAGGTAVVLALDDAQQFAVPGGRTIPFFGVNHASYYIGSHGYITFTAGDTEWRPSLTAHFRLPRISGMFYDIDPRRGAVRRQELADRIAVTYLGLPETYQSGSNSLQIEMFYDGRIRLTWLEIGASAPVGALPPLVGLSRGAGLPAGFINSAFVSFPPGARFADWAPGQELTPALLRHYALGGAGSPPAAGELPRTVFTGDRLSLSAVVRDNDPGLRVTGESVDEISGLWSNLGVTVRGRRQGVSQAEVGPGFERREYAVPVGGAERRFLRLRVELD